ncbi:hypothetical protein HKD37_04G011192 [Glycine soja]
MDYHIMHALRALQPGVHIIKHLLTMSNKHENCLHLILLQHKVERAHARLKRLFHDSMRDLCSCWDALNTMLVLQHTNIKASFQRSINVIKHKFNTTLHKKLRNFVSREAQDLIFHELQRADTIGIDSFVCGCTLRVTHSLPCACELTKFMSIYGYIPLKSIHMLCIRSSYNTSDFWGDLTLTHKVDALFNKIPLKTKVHKLAFMDMTSMYTLATKIKTKGVPKSVKSTKHEPSISGTPTSAHKANENYGYKEITAALSQEKLLELITSLYVECGPVSYEKWITIPDMCYVIASQYNIVLIYLSRMQSWTFFSLRGLVPTKPHRISIGLINANSFGVSTSASVFCCK